MEIETPESIVQIESSDNKNFEINVIPNIAQHILSVGPSYTTDSFKFKAANVLSANMSGVLGMFIFIDYQQKQILIGNVLFQFWV